MRPGITVMPVASMRSTPSELVAASLPTATIRSPATTTSPTLGTLPSPSMTRPFSMTRVGRGFPIKPFRAGRRVRPYAANSTLASSSMRVPLKKSEFGPA